MQKFWQVSFSLTACYGAVVIGMSAAISHLFSHSLDSRAFASLLSSTAVLAFQTLALLLLSQWQLQRVTAPSGLVARLWPLLVAFGFHFGLWLFVYTVWAGIFTLPMHFSQLAPVGGQLLLVSWLLLAVTPWIRK